jgi:excisionase family DNA binding protein
MDGEAEWLNTETAGRYLNLPTTTIYRMVREGRLPALRFPVRIHRQHLDTVLERCRIKPGELAHLNRSRRQPTN